MRNQQNAHFFINDLIQIYCLRHVSNNYVFIISKTVQAALRYFIMQSGRWQDVFDTKNIQKKKP